MLASEPQSEKGRLRLEMRARLSSQTPASASLAGHAVSDRVLDLEAYEQAARVGLFRSRSDEIDTAPLARRVLDAGKALLLPRMTDDRKLEFVFIEDLEQLTPRRHGILEPPSEWPATPPVAGDLFCLPGLAFDRAGGRLGRGGGYYDRTFAAVRSDPFRIRLIGIGFSFQLIERVPMTQFDLRLDGVVTDLETVESATGRYGRAL